MSETINIWSDEAAQYDSCRPHPPLILLDILTQLAQAPHPELVVDLGSGTGLSTLIWAERARRVIGIEPNDSMRHQAELRATLFPGHERVQFQSGLSTQTGLSSACADIVTCSQSLHWMEPEPTFAEVARILRPGGVFAAYDYDWPPTVHWAAENAYYDVISHFRAIRAEREFDRNVKSWSKEKHLARMRESGLFRHLKEITVHHKEQGNAERFIELTLSYGIARYLKQAVLTEEEFGLHRLRNVAQQVIGQQPIPWYFSYRVRIGIT